MIRIKKEQDKQKMLVKQLHKDLIKSKKKLEHNKYLNDYDKKNTLYFLQNVEKTGDVARPSSSKSPDVDDINALCYKIMFYSKQYYIYKKHYDEFNHLNYNAFNNYKVFLRKLVSHLRVKKLSLINDLLNKK